MLNHGNSAFTLDSPHPATNRCTELERRQEEDSQRDALDALTDAEHLAALLFAVSHTLSNPSTSYILNDRVRADFASRDLDAALASAQALVKFNQDRFNQARPTTEPRA